MNAERIADRVGGVLIALFFLLIALLVLVLPVAAGFLAGAQMSGATGAALVSGAVTAASVYGLAHLGRNL